MIVKSIFNGEAKSANEQQETPSKKPCCKKIEGVVFRTIQHSAQQRSSISVSLS